MDTEDIAFIIQKVTFPCEATDFVVRLDSQRYLIAINENIDNDECERIIKSDMDEILRLS